VKVLFDHQTFSHQKFGGNSRYFHELMNVFHAEGAPSFDLGVAVSPNEYLSHAPYYRGRRSPDTGTAAFLRRYLRNELYALRLARRTAYDVVHATFYDPGVQRLVRGSKLVVTVLDMIPEHFPEYFTVTGLYGRFVTKRWIEGKRTLCERADAILAISETTKRDVVTFYGIDPARITVTHLGNRLSGGGDAPRPTGFPPRYVLFVGTRNTYKNFGFFLEAAAPVLGDAIGIACIGGGAFDAGELALIDRLGLGGRVVQRSVADHELAACYAHAAAFVFPSRYEGFGIPILEAFACGCPALLANASCFPEIAGDAARYFDPNDRDSLGAALSDVLANDRVADDLRAKGKGRARTFTWEATAHRTYDAYQKVCAA
jgi:glycosyltransferase involved in cell wall biosynthesis